MKLRITHSGGQTIEVETPVSIEAIDDDKPEKPEKKLIELYWSQAAKYMRQNIDYGLDALQRPDLDPEQFARAVLGEHHDAPWVFWWLGRHFEDERAIGYARRILDLVTPYIVGQGEGMPGYHCYNRGAIAVGRPDIARNIADLSNYSSTKHQTPSNPNWKKYASPGASHARDFSLATIAHLLWQDDMKERDQADLDAVKRNEYIVNVRDHILLANARWHVDAGRNATDDELATTWRERWYPYIITHLCRALIELHSRTKLTADYPLIPELCDVMWDRAYRESVQKTNRSMDRVYLPQDGPPVLESSTKAMTMERKHGLAYQMDRTDPAPDLSLHTMPCFAYAWKLTGDKSYRERALRLMESGLKWAFLSGHRQFCQSYMWSHQGLKWLNLT